MKRFSEKRTKTLLDQCKNKSRAAQSEVYKLYYKTMFNSSFRILGNIHDAEDVMQDAFITAFDKIDNIENLTSFEAWLRRIVINKSIDFYKKKKDYPLSEYQEKSLTDESEESKEIPVELEMKKFKLAMEKLAKGYRLILSLYYIEGYDHEEISEILKISNSTSRSQLARARKRLLEELKKND